MPSEMLLVISRSSHRSPSVPLAAASSSLAQEATKDATASHHFFATEIPCRPIHHGHYHASIIRPPCSPLPTMPLPSSRSSSQPPPTATHLPHYHRAPFHRRILSIPTHHFCQLPSDRPPLSLPHELLITIAAIRSHHLYLLHHHPLHPFLSIITILHAITLLCPPSARSTITTSHRASLAIFPAHHLLPTATPSLATFPSPMPITSSLFTICFLPEMPPSSSHLPPYHHAATILLLITMIGHHHHPQLLAISVPLYH